MVKHAMHHVSRRKRVSQKLQPYPHPKPWGRYLDRLVLFMAVVGPLLTLPQVIQIFSEKNASGVSLVTWTLFALTTIPWVAYGIYHKDKPILISSILWIVLDLAVVVGVVLYAY